MQVTITLDMSPNKLGQFLHLLTENEETPVRPTTAPVETPTPAAEPAAPVETPRAPAEKTVTKDDLFAVALKCSKAGKQKELAEVFAKHGGKKLSDIAEADYADVLAELSRIEA